MEKYRITFDGNLQSRTMIVMAKTLNMAIASAVRNDDREIIKIEKWQEPIDNETHANCRQFKD